MVGETPSSGNAGASGAAPSGGAPASTTPAASSTPASTPSGSSPASTSGEGSAVASFERAAKALESASSTDTPADGAKPVGAVADATKTGTPAEQAAAAAAGGAQKPAGEQQFHLPQTKAEYDRIIGNARNNAIKSAGLEWATKVKQQDVANAVNLMNEIQADPLTWARGILQEAGQAAPDGKEEELVDPTPAYTSPDGKAQFYSHDQMAVIMQNFEKRLMKTMQPALTAAQRQEQQQAQAAEMREVQQQATTTATEVMGILKQDPRFETHKAALREALGKVDPEVRAKIGTIATLFMCWNKVVAEKVIPGMEAGVEKRLQSENQRQAAASVGNIVPGGNQQVRKPVRDGDVTGLATRIGELAGQMGYQG